MSEADIDSLDYEAALTALEKTVHQLGKEQDDLAEAVRIYERGLALAARCATLLKDAESRLGRAVAGSERAATT